MQSELSNGVNMEKYKKHLTQIYTDQYIDNEYQKAKKQAEEELAKIHELGKATPLDFLSNTSGVDTSNPLSVIANSAIQDANPITTIKKLINAKNKDTQTLINNYEQIGNRMASQDMSVEEYTKNKILRDMISNEIKQKNNNLFAMSENFQNSALRGTQNFVTGAEQALLSFATNNRYADTAMSLLNLTEEEKEAKRKELFNTGRDFLTREGEQGIAYQQKLNDIAYSGFTKLAMDAGFTVGEMTIPILLGIATGNIATGVGTKAGMSAEAISSMSANASKIASLGSMYADVFGHSYTEAIDQNASTRNAELYAHAMASAETLSEMIGGESIMSLMVGRPANTLIGKLMSKGTSNIKSRLAKSMIALFTDVGAESIEEVMTALVDPAIKKATLGGPDVNIEDVLGSAYEDAIGSLIPSIIFMGLSKPMVIAQVNNAESRMKSQIQNATFLTEEQKNRMSKIIADVSADARLGINENYDNEFSAVQDEINQSFVKNMNVFGNALTVQNMTGISDEDMFKLAQNEGFVYNPNIQETQEAPTPNSANNSEVGSYSEETYKKSLGTSIAPQTTVGYNNVEKGEMSNGLFDNRLVQQNEGEGNKWGDDNTSVEPSNQENTKAKNIQTLKNNAPENDRQRSVSAGKEADRRIAEVMKIAKEHFGTTEDYNYGAWLTPDGDLLNFQGTRYSTKEPYRKDHYNVIFPTKLRNEDVFSKYGAIRLSPETPSMYISVEPTPVQYEKLTDYIKNFVNLKDQTNPFTLEIPAGKGYVWKDYTIGTSPATIIKDIKNFFATGILPDGNEYNLVANKGKNLSARYTEERLDGIIEKSKNEKHPNSAKSYITRMTPEQFLQLTLTPEQQTWMENEDPYTHALNTEELRGEDQNIHLTIDLAKQRVVGHEGRHRMIALKNAGFKNVDVEIELEKSDYLDDNYNWKDTAHIDELRVKGQWVGRNKEQKNLYGKATTLKDLDPVSYNNIDYIKEKYLGERNSGDILYEPAPTNESPEQGSFSVSDFKQVTNPETLPETKRKFMEELKQVGYINVNGAKIGSIEELADLCQCFRDPIAETLRVLYTKGDTVVMQSAYTRNDPRVVPINAYRLANDVKKICAETGADGFWVMHNHPDSQAIASGGDKGFTKALGGLFPVFGKIQFRGHVVIDHNEYSIVRRNGTSTDHVKLNEATYNEVEKDFSKEGWTGLRLFGNKSYNEKVQKVASLASYVKNGKNLSTLILATNWGDVRVLQSLPNEFFTNNKRKVKQYIKDLALKNGATAAFYATQDKQTFNNMYSTVGSSPGIVLYEALDDGSIKILDSYSVGNTMLYASKQTGAVNVAPSAQEQLNGPQTTLQEIKDQFKPAQEETKEVEKEEPLKKETATFEKTEPQKSLTIEKQNEDIEKLEKAVDKYKSELEKQKTRFNKYEGKYKAQIERGKKKYASLSQYAKDLRFEKQFTEKARTDGIKFPKEYRDLYVGLRNTNMSAKEAYQRTKEIYDESQFLNRTIDEIMKTINQLRKKGVYNKLPNDIKKKIDAYDKFWTKSRQQSDLTLARRVLDSTTIREYIGKVALSKSVKNKIMSMEGYGWENGKGSVSFEEYFNGSKQLAKQFLEGVKALQEEVEDFQAINKQVERTAELEKIRQENVGYFEKEVKAQDSQKIRQFIKRFTNKTLTSSQMTLKTETQAISGGNLQSPLMIIPENLQNGEVRKKQFIVNVYKMLNEFRTKSGGLNRLIGSVKWEKEIEKSLSVDSDWVNTGIKVDGQELRLARSMIMSLAMHLQNDQNMQHISGGLVNVYTDEEGNTTPDQRSGKPLETDYYINKAGNKVSVFRKGKGVRVPNETLYKRSKNQPSKVKEAYDRGKTVTLTYDQVKQLAGMLTEEEKAFVSTMRKVFDYTTEAINEVSNRIFGYDLATVVNYFPIRVWSKGEATGAVMKAITTGNYGDALNYLLNPGWLQNRVSSYEPIYLENIADAMNRTVNSVATYYGYAEALRDNNIILNATMPDGTPFVKTLNYLSSDFMKDYNKLTRFIVGLDTNGSDAFRSFMAMNTLTFNVGTWLTQPMSFFNTMKYYTGKEFMQGISPTAKYELNDKIREYYKTLGLDTTKIPSAQLFRMFIAKATPNLDYRAIGYKMTNISQLLSKDINDKLGVKGIQLFDDIAVTAIARMQAYILSLDPNIKFGSQEYFDTLGARLTQILVETQPEYSQVNRANMFRSNNSLMRALSLFGTPANQMYNNFMQSAMDYRYNLREGNKKEAKSAFGRLAKSIGGIIGSSISVALIRALRDTIRAKDDDDTEFNDRVKAQFVVAMLSPTLIGDDVASFIMSNAEYGGVNTFDFSTPDTTFVNGIQTLGNAINSLPKEGVSPTKKVVNVVKALGTITPVDTRSLVRISEATMKFVSPETFNAYTLQNDSTIYKKWAENSDTDMAEFYKAYTATREKSLEENYGYIKGSKSGTSTAKKAAFERALRDVLPSSEVKKYMEILGGYKTK